MRISSSLKWTFLGVLCAYALFMAGMGFKMAGSPRDFSFDLSFWGSILRKEELTVWRLKKATSQDLSAPEIEVIDGQRNFWDQHSAYDKPALFVFKQSPRKPMTFSGPRVDIYEDEDPLSSRFEFPEAPQIRLRLPSS